MAILDMASEKGWNKSKADLNKLASVSFVQQIREKDARIHSLFYSL